jgi:subtilisin family serine protease
MFHDENRVPSDVESTIVRAGGKLHRRLPQAGFVVASGNVGFAASLESDPQVLAVVPDEAMNGIPDQRTSVRGTGSPTLKSHALTSATYFAQQWNMRAIHADEAWAAGYQGSPSVRVAILDSGIDPTHRELEGVLNTAASVSFVENLPDVPSCSDPSLIAASYPGAPEWVDLNSHGTHVAGIVAAQGNGVAGVAPRVSLIAVKVANVCGLVFPSWVIAGAIYAADLGVDVINMSIAVTFPRSCRSEGQARGESRDPCKAVHSAIQRTAAYANRRGALLVAAAGNAATNFDHVKDSIVAPAEFNHVIAVSATGPVASMGIEADTPTRYTNYGLSLVDLAAPGGETRRYPVGDWQADMVLSACSRFSLLNPECRSGNAYMYRSGTSMAAPHVTGVAALVDSIHGGALKPAHLQSILFRSADSRGKPGQDVFFGHGRVNAARAVNLARN